MSKSRRKHLAHYDGVVNQILHQKRRNIHDGDADMPQLYSVPNSLPAIHVWSINDEEVSIKCYTPTGRVVYRHLNPS